MNILQVLCKRIGSELCLHKMAAAIKKFAFFKPTNEEPQPLMTACCSINSFPTDTDATRDTHSGNDAGPLWMVQATNLLRDTFARLSVHRLSSLQVDSVPPALLFLVPVFAFSWDGLLLLALLVTVAVVEHLSSRTEVNVLSP